MDQLSLGVISRSRKESERRLAIHPLHVERIDAGLRAHIYLEQGYGERFGVPDEQLAPLVAGLRTREQILADCDVVLLPKPQAQDLAGLHDGQVLWGWPHCVQDEQVTQLAIDRRLTLIAFEAMNFWSPDGSFSLHVFHKNNELAGYCSVLHALELIGTTGDYGRRLRAAVIGFGATGRGAVTGLNAHGISDVDVLTHRDVNAVASPIHSARIVRFESDGGHPGRSRALLDNGPVPLAAFLAEHDIVVNCVLQDTDAPLMFVTGDDLGAFAPGSLIVDVSCDEGMGFGWARPTSFAEPDAHGRRQHPLLRRRSQPVAAVELRYLGDQRGPAAAPAHGPGRARGLGGGRDHPAGHRDPGRAHPERAHPHLPASRARLPVPAGEQPRRPVTRRSGAGRAAGGPRGRWR